MKSKNNNSNNAFSRVVPMAFLKVHADVARAQRWQNDRDACIRRIEDVVGEEIPADLLAAFTNCFEQFRGQDTTPRGVDMIHENMIRISNWSRGALMAQGRSTFAVSPMLATLIVAKENAVRFEFDVNGQKMGFPVLRTTDGFSVEVPDTDRYKNRTGGLPREIGSVGADFGIIIRFPGVWFTDGRGTKKQDDVKIVVFPSVEADGRLFNDMVKSGDAENVRRIVLELNDQRFTNAAAYRAGVDAGRRAYAMMMAKTIEKAEAAAPKPVAAVVKPAVVTEVAAVGVEVDVVAATLAAEQEQEAAAIRAKLVIQAAEAKAKADEEIAAGQAACEAKAQDDAVASAVANDPEAARVMQEIAAETTRREQDKLEADLLAQQVEANARRDEALATKERLDAQAASAVVEAVETETVPEEKVIKPKAKAKSKAKRKAVRELAAEDAGTAG